MPILEINNHKMYFEVHGVGPPALCMGGWGTYCHGNERHVGSYLLENYQVLMQIYRTFFYTILLLADIILKNTEKIYI